MRTVVLFRGSQLCTPSARTHTWWRPQRRGALLATSARAVDNDGGGRQKPPPGVSRASCVGSLLSLGTQCACGSCRGAGVAWQRCEFGADGRCDVGSAAPPLVVLPEGDAAPDFTTLTLSLIHI